MPKVARRKSKEIGEVGWICSICTFQNAAFVFSCKICFTPKPTRRASQICPIATIQENVTPKKRSYKKVFTTAVLIEDGESEESSKKVEKSQSNNVNIVANGTNTKDIKKAEVIKPKKGKKSLEEPAAKKARNSDLKLAAKKSRVETAGTGTQKEPKKSQAESPKSEKESKPLPEESQAYKGKKTKESAAKESRQPKISKVKVTDTESHNQKPVANVTKITKAPTKKAEKLVQKPKIKKFSTPTLKVSAKTEKPEFMSKNKTLSESKAQSVQTSNKNQPAMNSTTREDLTKVALAIVDEVIAEVLSDRKNSSKASPENTLKVHAEEKPDLATSSDSDSKLPSTQDLLDQASDMEMSSQN